MMLYIGSLGFVFNQLFPNSYNAADEQSQSERISELEEFPVLQNS